MSSFPRHDLSSHYKCCSGLMNSSLKKIIQQDYVVTGKIQPGVLSDAQELFGYGMKLINGQPLTSKESTAWLMILDHLEKIDPKKYKYNTRNHLQIRRDVRNLASLLNNIGELEQIPEDQREYVSILQKFFELLSITGEEATSEHNAT
jgi:hypothetical protein